MKNYKLNTTYTTRIVYTNTVQGNLKEKMDGYYILKMHDKKC